MKKLIPMCMAMVLPVLPVSAEVKLSEKLTKIAGHLGEGGAHFSVTDSEDDLKDLGSFLDEVLAVIPDAELPTGFKVGALFDDLGLYAVQGSGSSAHEVGGLWHNRTFVLTDGNHEGVLSLVGKESGKTAAHDFAPAGADLVLETELNLREIERMMRKLSKSLGPEAEAEAMSPFMEQLGDSGMSLADLFVDFSVRGTLVLWLDEEKEFEMGPEMKFPVPHFAARLDNAGMVWTLLKSQLGETSTLTKDGDEVVMVPKEAKQESPFGPMEPRFVWNAESKQLFFSMTAEDLAVCRGDGAKIMSDADFKRATVGFPEKTNGLAYVSKDFMETALGVARKFAGEMPPEAQPIVEKVMPHLDKLAGRGGYAGAFSVEEDGFLFVANLPMPMKGGSGLSGITGISTVAMLAGGMSYSMGNISSRAEEMTQMNDMKMYAVAQAGYQAKNGRFANSLEELGKDGFFDEDSLDQLEQFGLSMLVADGKPSKGRAIGFMSSNTPDDVNFVAYSDGSVRKMTNDDLMLLLQAE